MSSVSRAGHLATDHWFRVHSRLLRGADYSQLQLVPWVGYAHQPPSPVILYPVVPEIEMREEQ